MKDDTAAHALDVSTLDGGETRLERWIEKHGADATRYGLMKMASAQDVSAATDDQ